MWSLAGLLAAAALMPNFDAVVAPYADLGRFSGTVLVAQHDKVLYEKAFGLASVELGIPNKLNTRFNIGSLSKQFTAACILSLEAEGKLSVHDKIAKLLPDYPSAVADKVTVENLLDHTSGIPSVGRRDGVNDPNEGLGQTTLDEIVQLSQSLPLQFEPGAEFRYSNTGYAILAQIVERVSGRPFDAYLHDHVFEPAGMRDTGHIHVQEIVPGLATGYMGYQPDITLGIYRNPSWDVGYAGIYSTVADLFRWHQALTAGKILPKPQLDEFLTEHVPKELTKRTYGYGYGWFFMNWEGNTVINHGGTAESGYVCEDSFVPSEGLFIAVLSNYVPELGADAPMEISRNLFRIHLGRPTDGPPQLSKQPAANFSDVQGVYDFGEGFTCEVKVRDGIETAACGGRQVWSFATLADQRSVDKNDPEVKLGLNLVNALLTNQPDIIKPHVASGHEPFYSPKQVLARTNRFRSKFGELVALSPLRKLPDRDGFDVQTRVDFRKGSVFLQLELDKDQHIRGEYWDYLMPASVPLLATVKGGFFVDGFRYGRTDAELHFERRNGQVVGLTLLGKVPLKAKRVQHRRPLPASTR